VQKEMLIVKSIFAVFMRHLGLNGVMIRGLATFTCRPVKIIIGLGELVTIFRSHVIGIIQLIHGTDFDSFIGYFCVSNNSE
jgi:hypothetical protein